MTEAVTANFDNTVDIKDMKFNFKKDKLGNKRASVELKVPVPSVEGIINILQTGGKGLELLQDAVYDVVRAQVADLVSNDEKISQETFDSTKATWDFIANMPKEDRRSSSIPEEQWAAFAKDYIEVMPGVTNKSAEAVTNATEVYLKKFSIVKTNKPVLAKLKEQLGLFIEHSPNAEQFTEILDLLLRKVDTYLAANDVEMLVANL